MKKKIRFIRLLSLGLIIFGMLLTTLPSFSKPGRDFYQIKIYHLKNKAQADRVDQFLEKAYVPALHRTGIKKVGVFKAVDIDTATDKRIYVLIPFHSLEQFYKTGQLLDKDSQLEQAGKDYLDAAYNDAPYNRIESILLQAFPGMPSPEVPALSTPKSERIYELRSYEGPTEKLYKNKVKMFNDGNEIGIFKRLGFHALFYAEVLSGSRMPNLMYMTTFSNKASRDEHWKAFGADPEWKKLSAMPEYQHNVSKADIFFLHPAEYSDF